MQAALQQKDAALSASDALVADVMEQQTATAEILRVIAGAPSDLQSILDAIAQRTCRLCDARHALIMRVTETAIIPVASYGRIATELREGPERRQDVREFPLNREWVGGRAAIERRTIHVHDLASDGEYPVGREAALRIGHRTTVSTPLLADTRVIGVIGVYRDEVRPFTDRQIKQLESFADQAVIAIENVRLFTELEAKNRALTSALDQQTATGEILRIIASSPTDVQPVFEAIVARAAVLCEAAFGALLKYDGELLHSVATTNASKEQRELIDKFFPWRPTRDLAIGDAVLDARTVHVEDAATSPLTPSREYARRALGHRTLLAVPLLRDARVIGLLMVWRTEVRAFDAQHIGLVQTFADQAVIAVENVRLFSELQERSRQLSRSVQELTALGDVARAVNSTLDLETVLTTIVSRAVELSGLDGGVVFEYDEHQEVFVHRATTELGGRLAAARRGTEVRKGEGVVGRTAVTLEPAQVPDITIPGAYESRLRENLIASGIRSILAVPMVREDRLIGTLVVTRNQPGEFPSDAIELLRTFTTQSALAIQNARLFHELQIKSAQLEVASQHKSDFLASMSHELRTPLNAVIGFSDVLLQGMFGETNEKQTEYLRDILASGQHLLSLINDILDLSKIEAGKMELELTDFDAPAAIDNAMMLIRERATRRGQMLERAVDLSLGQIRADERKFKQVLLNLLSNAVKFTPEGGQITVGASVANGEALVSVTDTGIGIAPEHQALVFEEFRQVGHADKKAEGTGLGLALCRKFIELHGGRIWLTSGPEKGSSFTFALPVAGPPAASHAGS